MRKRLRGRLPVCLLPACLCLFGLAAPPAWSAQVSGRVVFLNKEGKAAPELADARQAIASFQPHASTVARPAPVTAEMSTRGKEFVPTVLAVPRGSTVKFPNFDPILHNVFSVSGANRFDLGLYSKGPGKSWTFNSAGVVRVFCNVHHTMVGYVLVLDTAYSDAADSKGAFLLAGLPEGGGKLTVWHPQADPWTAEVKAGAAPPEVRLTVVRARVPQHTNKQGQAYAKERRDRYDG